MEKTCKTCIAYHRDRMNADGVCMVILNKVEAPVEQQKKMLAYLDDPTGIAATLHVHPDFSCKLWAPYDESKTYE